MLKKVENRLRRAARVRSRIQGNAERPRLSIFRSNTRIYAQLIDDVNAVTICSASDLKISSGTKTEKATQVGDALAKIMLEKGIKTCVFDRGGYLYHGRVKALADAVRAAGIAF